MTLGPILPGRLPTSLAVARAKQSLQQQNQLLQRLKDQISTGQRFFIPSEAPAAATRTIVLQKTIERANQLRTNLSTDQSFLEATESSLGSVSEALNRAKQLLFAGLGDTTSSAEKEALAVEAGTLVRQVVNAANSEFRDRFLFGGTETNQLPFEFRGNGIVAYRGDALSINSFVDFTLLLPNNVDGQTAFATATPPVGSDLDPALTLQTKVADLHGGEGVQLGTIVVTLDNGTPETATIDLSGAETIGDIKTRLEAAFPIPSGSLTLNVDVDPTSNFGLRLTPSAGTVAVSDLSGSTVAADLGIAGPAAPTINGGDLDPRLTPLTPVAALNGGTGIGTTGGNTFLITKGSATHTIDVASASTVEDILNLIRTADRDVQAEINAAGNGLAVSSRLNGALFSIGENNDTIATDLGIRTMTGQTLLADLNRGLGVPVDETDSAGNLLPAPLNITRRDGTQVTVDVKGTKTVQDVIDAVNAVDPGVLVASLNAVGNGITIVDDDGVSAGPLIVEENEVSRALGVNGQENSGSPSAPLVGTDVNPLEPPGVINLLLALQEALAAEDDRQLSRLAPLIDEEIGRLNLVRGSIGSRLQALEEINTRLEDGDTFLQESLSREFDTDMTTAVTQLAFQQSALQATLQIAASTFELTLFNFL